MVSLTGVKGMRLLQGFVRRYVEDEPCCGLTLDRYRFNEAVSEKVPEGPSRRQRCSHRFCLI